MQSLNVEQLGPVQAAAESSFVEDLRECIRRARCSVLAFFGSNDLLQPIARSAAPYR